MRIYKFYSRTIVILAFLTLILSGGCGTQDKNKQTVFEQWNKARNDIALDLARKQMTNGQIDKAVSTVQETLKKSPDFPDGWLLLSQLYIYQDMPEMSRNCLKKCLEQAPDHPEGNYQMGLLQEMMGNNITAIEYYQKAQTGSPDNIDYILAEVELLASMNKISEAIDIAEKQIKLGRNSPELYLITGNLYFNNDQYQKATAMYMFARKLNPNNVVIADKLIFSLMKTGQYEDAAKQIKSVMAEMNRENDKNLQLALADCYLYTGQYVNAQRAYETLIRKHGVQKEYLCRMAQVTLARNDLERATDTCSKILALEPENNEATLLLAVINLKQRQYDISQNLAQNVINRDQDDPLAWCILGRAYSGQGEILKAEECYQQAEKLNPGNTLTEQLLNEIQQLRLSNIENNTVTK